MLRILRELESNLFAVLALLLAWISLMLIIGALVVAFTDVTMADVFQLVGIGGGGAVAKMGSQAVSNRSQYYKPLIANPEVKPLPAPGPRDPGDLR